VKNLSLKISCLLAALLIWMLVAGTTMVESDVGLPLEVVGLGDGLTVGGSALPELGLVKLRVSKLRLLAHQYFGRSLGAVRVDLSGLQPGPPLLFELKEADVRTEAEVVTLLPPVRLPLRLDWEETRRVPVRVPLRGRLPQDRLLAGPLQVRPDSVDVIGPRRFFGGLDSLATEPIDLAGLQRTLARDVPLVPPPRPLRTAGGTVHVTLPVAALAERVMANIPVLPLVESHLGEAGVSPPVCDVLVRGPADSVAALSPARLTVIVPVTDLGPGVHQVAGEVRHPAWVVSIQLEPPTFMVLVGQATAGEDPR
jgi:hypothetical protein